MKIMCSPKCGESLHVWHGRLVLIFDFRKQSLAKMSLCCFTERFPSCFGKAARRAGEVFSAVTSSSSFLGEAPGWAVCCVPSGLAHCF